jgi:hypothetical protein
LWYNLIRYNSNQKAESGVVFNDDFDLYASLHRTNIIVVGNVNTGKLKVQLTDYYDFKKETIKGSPFKKLALVANNLAFIGQESGYINGYEIYIDIEYYVE